MKYFILTGMLCACLSLSAQQLLKGLVIDAETKRAISGATVQDAGKLKSVITDKQGRFQIASSADSLIISCLGYYSVKRSVSDAILVALYPSINPLNEVVVSASREQQQRKDVPAAIGKVNAATIQDTRATAIYQLLNKVSGVYMVNLGNEQHTMAIRQPISYNALYLYMEDGLPIRPTGIFNHNGLYEINMNAVKDIEVIKGPSSSLYGSNSIGGAVNFISNPVPVHQSVQVSMQGDGFNYYRGDVGAGFSSGKFGLYVSGYVANQKDSWQDYTNFNKYCGSLKSTYRFSPATQITFSGSYNYLYTQTPGNLDSVRFYSRNYGSNQRFTYRDVKAFRASSRLDHSWNSRNNTFLTAFFRDNSTGQLPHYYIADVRDASKKYVKSVGQENNQSFKSYGFLMQHRADFDFLKSRLFAGIYLDNSPSSYYANFLNINKDPASNYYTGYVSTDSVIDNYKIDLLNTAAFVQYQIQPAAAVRIVAGLRYDNVRYNFRNSLPEGKTKYKQTENNNFDVLAPKLGITYDLQKGRGLYANYSLGFQPPETSVLYNSRQVSELKQASFYNYELGGWLPMFNRKFLVELSLYNMEGRNEIISVLMPDNTTQNQNAGATRHLGVEYSLLMQPFSTWNVRFSGTLAKHSYLDHSEILLGKTVVYDGNRMSNAPSWIANTEFSWKPKFVAGFRSALEWQHINRYFINPANTKSYTGYDVFNLRMGYEMKSRLVKGTGLWLNVINIGDVLYASNVTANQYGATYNAASPRTISLGISYKFQKSEK